MPTALPAKNILDGTTAPTTSTMKTAMGQMRDFLAERIGADATAGAGSFTTLAATGNTTLGDAATDTVAVQAGSAALPVLIPSGDPNTGLWFPAADTVAVSTAGVERLRVSSTGALTGAAPAATTGYSHMWTNAATETGSYAKWMVTNAATDATGLGLTVLGTAYTTAGAYVQDGAALDCGSGLSGGLSILAQAGGMRFYTGGTAAGNERMRIDNSGNVGVGDTPTASKTYLGGSTLQKLAVAASATSALQTIKAYSTTGAHAGILTLAHSKSATIGTESATASGDALGAIAFEGVNSGSGIAASVYLVAYQDGAAGATYVPGRLAMFTSDTAAGAPAERWRLAAGGTVATYQPAPTAKSTTATLTAAEMATNIITASGTSYTITLPTGTDTDTGFGLATDTAFDWSLISTASGTVTLGTNTGHSIVGTATVAAGASARWRTRKTAANTYVTSRIA